MNSINTWKKRGLALTGAAVLVILVMLTGCPANPFYGLEPKPRDSEGPDVTIINPEEDQVLSGLLVITGIATDKYQIDSVSIIIDGGSPVKLDGTNNWYYLLDTTKISEGEHTVTILAKDQFGNTSQTPVTFTVDQTVPNINVDLDPDIDDTAVWLSGTDALITGTATDDYAVDRVEISFDGVTFNQADYDSGTDTWSYTVADTSSILPGDGTTIAYLRVTDSAGLPGSTNFPLYIVNAVPTFTFTYPVNDQNIDASEDLSGNILEVTIEADDGAAAIEALDHIDIKLESTALVGPAFTTIESLDNAALTGTNLVEIDVTDIKDKGPVDLTVTAVNKSGTETAQTIAIAFDDNPPVMGDTVTADGQPMDDDLTNPDINFTDESVTFEGTVATVSVASAQVKLVDSATLAEVFGYTGMSGGVVGGAWSHVVDFGLYGDGEYDLVFKITEDESDGGGFDTVTRSIRHDATAPAVTVDEPTDSDPGDGIEVGVGTVPIGGEITNASSGSPIDSISITVDDGSSPVTYGPFTAPDWTGISYSSGQFSYLWDNTAFSTGTDLDITATVYDLAGNEGISPVHTVQIAQGAPNASFDEHINPDSGLIIPIGAEPYINGGATIKGQATDSDGSIAAVGVKIDDAVDFTNLGLSGPSPLTWNYTLESLSEGQHTIYMQVEDNDGKTNIRSLGFTVDSVAPVITGFSADVSDGSGTSYLHGLANVTGSANDVSAGLESVELTVDEKTGDGPESLVVDGLNSFSAEWDTELLPTNGGTKIIAQAGIELVAAAVDRAGNLSTSTITEDVLPYISSLSTDTALLGDTGITVTGDNLGDGTPGNTTVTVGGGDVTVGTASVDSIVFDIPGYPPPAGLSSGPVIVTYNGVTNNGQDPVKMDLFYLREIVDIAAQGYHADAVFDPESNALQFAFGQDGGQASSREVYYLQDGDGSETTVQAPGANTSIKIAWGVDPLDPDLDGDGRTYIAYDDDGAGIRLEASTGAAWGGTNYAVDDTYTGNSFVDIAVDSAGYIHVVYLHGTELYYTRIEDGLTSAPTGAARIEDSSGTPATPDTETWLALALDSDDKPHIVYRDADGKSLKYTCNLTGVWRTPVTVDDSGNMGLFGNAIAVGSDNSVHVVYSDSTAGEIWYARAGTPTSPFIPTLIDSASNNQRFPSIALDSGNSPHVTYIDTTRTTPVYARKPGDDFILADVSDESVGMGKLIDSTATVIEPAGTIHSIYINSGTVLQDAIYLPE